MQVHAFGESHCKKQPGRVCFPQHLQSLFNHRKLFSRQHHEPYTVQEFQGEACFKMKFYFEIITDSYAVLRSNPERSHVPSTQFPPVTTSSKTIGQYHKQDLDIDADKIQDPTCRAFIASLTSLPPTPFSLYLLFLCWGFLFLHLFQP